MKVILHLATLFTIRPPPQNSVDQTVVSQYSSQFALCLSMLQLKPARLMQKSLGKHLFITSQVTA